MTAEETRTRFQGVENGTPATEQQREVVRSIRDLVVDLAIAIDAAPLHPRYKATALTELETAAMFAVKGVFQ